KNSFVANHLLRKIEKLETKAEEKKCNLVTEIYHYTRNDCHTIKQTTGFNPYRVDSTRAGWIDYLLP
ncbi:30S ribosomal protein S19 chloroplastic, partial [Bienertia sinuspersici]